MSITNTFNSYAIGYFEYFESSLIRKIKMNSSSSRKQILCMYCRVYTLTCLVNKRRSMTALLPKRMPLNTKLPNNEAFKNGSPAI